MLPALSKAGEILNTRSPRFFLKAAFIVIPFDPSGIPPVYAGLLSTIPRERREGRGQAPERGRRVFRVEADGRESFYESSPVFVFTRAKTGGKARMEKPSGAGSGVKRRRVVS